MPSPSCGVGTCGSFAMHREDKIFFTKISVTSGSESEPYAPAHSSFFYCTRHSRLRSAERRASFAHTHHGTIFRLCTSSTHHGEREA
jgi:hypothetical protein